MGDSDFASSFPNLSELVHRYPLPTEKLEELAASESSAPLGDKGIAWMAQLDALIVRARNAVPQAWDQTFAAEARACLRDCNLPRLARLYLNFVRAARLEYAESRWLRPPAEIVQEHEQLAQAWNQPAFEGMTDADRARQLAKDDTFGTQDSIVRKVRRLRKRGMDFHRSKRPRKNP